MTAHPIDTEALRGEIEAAVTDYQRVFPPPLNLAPNLALAVRALSDLAAAYTAWQLANRAESLTPTMITRRIKSLIADQPDTYGVIGGARSSRGQKWHGIRLAEQGVFDA